MKKTLILLSVLLIATIAFATPPQLDPQNCGSCDQIRLFYCQGEDSPELMSFFVEDNAAFVPGNSLVWYDDNAGTVGGLFNGTGEEPAVSTASTGKTFYWVAQNDGVSTGAARRVRVRVIKTPNVSIVSPPTPFCFGGQINLETLVSNPNKSADLYSFYDGDPNGSGSLIGTLQANKGVPVGNLVVSPQIGLNEYWVLAMSDAQIDCFGLDSMSLNLDVLALLDPISDVTVTDGDAVDLTFTSPNASFVLWVDNGSFNNPDIGINGTAGLSNLSFVAANPGTTFISANIRVIAYRGNCAGELQDFSITVNPGPARLGFDNLSNQAFPNPFENEVTIRSDFDFSSARVFSIYGVLLESNKMSPGRSAKISFSNLPPGNYIVRIYGESRSQTFRVLKL